MKLVGNLSHVTKSGNLVLRGNDIPSLYSFVGVKNAKIGRIRDIVGPASKPYVIVKPFKKLEEREIAFFKDVLFYELPKEKLGRAKARVTPRRREFGKQG